MRRSLTLALGVFIGQWLVHDPAPEIDGILGNSFLAHDRFTLDADRRQVHLRPKALD